MLLVYYVIVCKTYFTLKIYSMQFLYLLEVLSSLTPSLSSTLSRPVSNLLHNKMISGNNFNHVDILQYLNTKTWSQCIWYFLFHIIDFYTILNVKPSIVISIYFKHISKLYWYQIKPCNIFNIPLTGIEFVQYKISSEECCLQSGKFNKKWILSETVPI